MGGSCRKRDRSSCPSRASKNHRHAGGTDRKGEMDEFWGGAYHRRTGAQSYATLIRKLRARASARIRMCPAIQAYEHFPLYETKSRNTPNGTTADQLSGLGRQ